MDDDWVLLSEIEHWSYCARQWAIIQLEQHFADNDDTVRGHLSHERVDSAGRESRGDTTTYWALDVRSDRLRLHGRCDRVVREGDRYIPIEHKSGRRAESAARLQLVAQAICLEEMLQQRVDEGRLYLASSKATLRVDVSDLGLRSEVAAVAESIRSARARPAALPPARNDQRCSACSLRSACMPELVAAPARQRGVHGATWWL